MVNTASFYCNTAQTLVLVSHHGERGMCPYAQRKTKQIPETEMQRGRKKEARGERRRTNPGQQPGPKASREGRKTRTQKIQDTKERE